MVRVDKISYIANLPNTTYCSVQNIHKNLVNSYANNDNGLESNRTNKIVYPNSSLIMFGNKGNVCKIHTELPKAQIVEELKIKVINLIKQIEEMYLPEVEEYINLYELGLKNKSFFNRKK